jgi:hypothetical protein
MKTKAKNVKMNFFMAVRNFSLNYLHPIEQPTEHPTEHPEEQP